MQFVVNLNFNMATQNDLLTYISSSSQITDTHNSLQFETMSMIKIF